VNDSAILRTLRQFIRDNYSYESVGDEESLLKKGIIDSIGVIELVTFVREKFSVRVEVKDIVPENFDSIAAVERFVLKSGKRGSDAS